MELRGYREYRGKIWSASGFKTSYWLVINMESNMGGPYSNPDRALVFYWLRPAALRVQYRADAMQDILDRKWFTRMWTLQELAMAKEPLVMCGGKVIRWNCVMWGIWHRLSLESNASILRAWKSVSGTEFFWLCLLEKQWFSAEQVEQSYRWILWAFDVGTPQRTIDLLHRIGNIISLLVAT